MCNTGSGFTLIETIIAVFIVALGTTILLVAFPNALEGAGLKESAHGLVSDLRIGRSRAIAHQRETEVTIDTQNQVVYRKGHRRQLKRLRNIRFIRPENTTIGNLVKVHFFPNGSSSGGKFMLVGKSATYYVSVDWLTGRVSLK